LSAWTTNPVPNCCTVFAGTVKEWALVCTPLASVSSSARTAEFVSWILKEIVAGSEESDVQVIWKGWDGSIVADVLGEVNVKARMDGRSESREAENTKERMVVVAEEQKRGNREAEGEDISRLLGRAKIVRWSRQQKVMKGLGQRE